jgi:hypothetical protein
VRNSSGAVVPVLSDNVHEARGYNRLAQMAKAPLIMLWQDDQVRRWPEGQLPPRAWMAGAARTLQGGAAGGSVRGRAVASARPPAR